MDSGCDGQHRFFVADVVGVEQEGKVFVLVVCTQCGEFKAHEQAVGRNGSQIRLLKQENKQNKE